MSTPPASDELVEALLCLLIASLDAMNEYDDRSLDILVEGETSCDVGTYKLSGYKDRGEGLQLLLKPSTLCLLAARCESSELQSSFEI